MLIKICLGVFCLLLFLGTNSSRFVKNQPAPSTSPGAATTQSAALTSGTQPGGTNAIPAFDACSLINSSQIATVQGTPVQQTEPTGYAYGDLNISQCYYTAINAGGKNLSVHLQVIQLNSNSARRDAVSEFWKARFKRPTEEGEENESKEKRREEREEAEEDAPGAPIPVSGIGDEAFWLASSRGGGLYVRRDQNVVRVLIGGSDDLKTQIEKTKTLARQALARLK